MLMVYMSPSIAYLEPHSLEHRSSILLSQNLATIEGRACSLSWSRSWSEDVSMFTASDIAKKKGEKSRKEAHVEALEVIIEAVRTSYVIQQ